jgi:hypothetical protein
VIAKIVADLAVDEVPGKRQERCAARRVEVFDRVEQPQEPHLDQILALKRVTVVRRHAADEGCAHSHERVAYPAVTGLDIRGREFIRPGDGRSVR